MRRPERYPAWVATWSGPLTALLVTAASAVGLFAALGANPGAGLWLFFVEPLHGVWGLSELALKATPLILCGLGLAVCYRAEVWNVGAEGQFLLGAIAGGGVALHAGDAAAHWMVVPVLFAGVLGGMAWAAVVAWLRCRFQASEILTSLMLVYVAQDLLGFLVSGPWRDPNGYDFPQTALFAAGTALPRLVPGTRLHVGFVLALLCVPLLAVMLRHSIAGFAVRVVGEAPPAALYAGFSRTRVTWAVLLLCGGLSGLAGAMEVAGPLGQLTPSVSPGYGFAAIVVAFIGRLRPTGVLLGGLLMALFYLGGELLQSRLGLPQATAGVLQGLLLVWLLVVDAVIARRIRGGMLHA